MNNVSTVIVITKWARPVQNLNILILFSICRPLLYYDYETGSLISVLKVMKSDDSIIKIDGNSITLYYNLSVVFVYSFVDSIISILAHIINTEKLNTE